jgi:hypothetical protein
MESVPIVAMDLPEREHGVKIGLIENQPLRLAYYGLRGEE